MSTPKLIEQIGGEPISIDECRAHLEANRYGDSEVDPLDDAMIEGFLGAAREHCENFLGLSLTTKVLEIALDEFPTHLRNRPNRRDDAIELPMGPVRQVLSIAWGDESDDEMNDDAFILDNYGEPARITPVSFAWPTVTSATNAVKIRYLAGYGVDSDGGQELPKAIRAAILLVLGELFANRENAGDGALAEIPTSAQALLRSLRVRMGMA